jgi:hypothetical protein
MSDKHGAGCAETFVEILLIIVAVGALVGVVALRARVADLEQREAGRTQEPTP